MCFPSRPTIPLLGTERVGLWQKEVSLVEEVSIPWAASELRVFLSTFRLECCSFRGIVGVSFLTPPPRGEAKLDRRNLTC